MTKALLHFAIILLIVTSGLLIIQGPMVDKASPISKFSISVEMVNVSAQMDGSVDIDYYIVFTNISNLNGVDIGMPNSFYDISTATAIIEMAGQRYIPSIVVSPHIAPGVFCEFNTNLMSRIESTGTFRMLFHINDPHMVYDNSLVANSVGVQFRPTWFDSSLQVGSTALLVENLFFPQGFDNASQALWLENRPWDSLGLNSRTGLIMATWTAASASPGAIEGGSYDFGGGFPDKYMWIWYAPGGGQISKVTPTPAIFSIDKSGNITFTYSHLTTPASFCMFGMNGTAVWNGTVLNVIPSERMEIGKEYKIAVVGSNSHGIVIFTQVDFKYHGETSYSTSGNQFPQWIWVVLALSACIVLILLFYWKRSRK